MDLAAIFTDLNKITGIANIIIAAGTIILAFVAIFGRTFSRWYRRPKLKIIVDSNPPQCRKTYLSDNSGNKIADCYYFRLWVDNYGNTSAKNVEVFASELKREKADGTLENVKSFTPMNLKWSNLGTLYFPAIHPKAGKYCDCFHVVDPTVRDSPEIGMENDNRKDIPQDKSILSFDTLVSANTKGHLQPPGKYQLGVIVAAENATAVYKSIEIHLTGDWYSDEELMLKDGVGFRPI